jgi:hypothetical protein
MTWAKGIWKKQAAHHPWSLLSVSLHSQDWETHCGGMREIHALLLNVGLLVREPVSAHLLSGYFMRSFVFLGFHLLLASKWTHC